MLQILKIPTAAAYFRHQAFEANARLNNI
jgi:hypothetical protein